MADMPDELVIPPYVYEVVEGPSIQLYEITDHMKQRITLSDEQSETSKRTTLMHEMLHAVFFVSGASHTLEPEEEERIIRSIEGTLFITLLNNLDVFEWMLSDPEADTDGEEEPDGTGQYL